MNHLLKQTCNEINIFQKRYYTLTEEFLCSVNKKNSLIIITTAILNMCLQAFNLLRVFTSNNKLNSLNNQIFFTFYITLFIVCFIPLLLRKYATLSVHFTYTLHLLFAIFYLYWNLLLNSYSLLSNPNSSKIVYISALIFTSILLRFKLPHIVILQVSTGVAFLVINHVYLSSGDVINITISIIASILCAALLHIQEVNMIYNKRELLSMNEELKRREDMLRLGLEKHQFIMEETNLFSFEWNLTEDTWIPSRNCSETLGWPSNIPAPLDWVKSRDDIFKADQKDFFGLIESCIQDKTRGDIDIRIKDCSMNYTWYRLQLFIQCDHHNTPTLVIGTLLNIDGSTRLIHNLNRQLHTQIEGTKQYLDQLKTEQEQTKIYRHDIRHSLKLMEKLAFEGNLKKLCSYLEATQEKLDSITPNHYCENEIVNLILGSFEQLAQEQHISFATDVDLPHELPIDDTELCALLFNLLENAITASASVTDKKLRYVKIRSVYRNNKLLVFTENGFSGVIQMADDLPIPISESENHGFGIKSIVSIVDNHGGLYSFDIDNQNFYAKILLEI